MASLMAAAAVAAARTRGAAVVRCSVRATHLIPKLAMKQAATTMATAAAAAVGTHITANLAAATMTGSAAAVQRHGSIVGAVRGGTGEQRATDWSAVAAVLARGMHTFARARTPCRRSRKPPTTLPGVSMVLVRVGYGTWQLLEPKGGWSKTMQVGDVLVAVANTTRFAVTLKDACLPMCKVRVLTTVGGSKAFTADSLPTDADSGAAVELAEQVTLGSLLGNVVMQDGSMWVHIHPPPVAAQTAAMAGTGTLTGECSRVVASFDGVVRAIRAGDYDTTPDGHIALRRGLTWPFATTDHHQPIPAPSVLFKRPAYAPLFDDVLRGLKKVDGVDATKYPYASCSYPRRIVTGQPGIGKRAFGWYAIFRLITAEQPRSVLYFHGGTRSVYFIDHVACTVWYVGRIEHDTEPALYMDFHNELMAGAVVVADSYLPTQPEPPCAMLVVSDPGYRYLAEARRGNSDLWNQYFEWCGTPLYMPIPSPAELGALRIAAFKDAITTAVFERRLAYWGPIPRLLFTTGTAPGADAAAAFGVHLEEVFHAAVAVPTSEAARDARHRYVLLRSVGDTRAGTSDPVPFCEAGFDEAPATYFTSPAWQALALKRDAVNRWRNDILRTSGALMTGTQHHHHTSQRWRWRRWRW